MGLVFMLTGNISQLGKGTILNSALASTPCLPPPHPQTIIPSTTWELQFWSRGENHAARGCRVWYFTAAAT